MTYIHVRYDGNGVVDFVRSLQDINTNMGLRPFTAQECMDMFLHFEKEAYAEKTEAMRLAMLRNALNTLSQSRSSQLCFLKLGQDTFVNFATDPFFSIRGYVSDSLHKTPNTSILLDAAKDILDARIHIYDMKKMKETVSTEEKITIWVAAADVLYWSVIGVGFFEARERYRNAKIHILSKGVMPRYAEIAAVVRYATRYEFQEVRPELERERLIAALHLQKRGGWN